MIVEFTVIWRPNFTMVKIVRKAQSPGFLLEKTFVSWDNKGKSQTCSIPSALRKEEEKGCPRSYVDDTDKLTLYASIVQVVIEILPISSMVPSVFETHKCCWMYGLFDVSISDIISSSCDFYNIIVYSLNFLLYWSIVFLSPNINTFNN